MKDIEQIQRENKLAQVHSVGPELLNFLLELHYFITTEHGDKMINPLSLADLIERKLHELGLIEEGLEEES